LRRSVWLLGGFAALAWMSVLAGTASADRQATPERSDLDRPYTAAEVRNRGHRRLTGK